MRSRFLIMILFFMFFLLAAAILWPAASLTPWVERASNGKLRLASAEGQVWNGSGVLLVRKGDSATSHSAESVQWKIRWGNLWRGRIGIEAGFENGSALASIGQDSLDIEQIDATLGVTLLGALLPGPLGRFGWAGSLNVKGKDFSCALKGRICQGEMEMLWRDAGVSEIPGGDLGDYRIRLMGEGQVLRFDLATLRGRLQIAGGGEISAGALRFAGEASAIGPASAQLNNFLRTIGRQGSTPEKILIDYRSTEPGS